MMKILEILIFSKKLSSLRVSFEQERQIKKRKIMNLFISNYFVLIMSLKSTIKTIIIVITTVTATPPEVIIMILNFFQIYKKDSGAPIQNIAFLTKRNVLIWKHQ